MFFEVVVVVVVVVVASAIACFSLSYCKLARHDLPVPSVQIDSGVWSEVLDSEKLNHDEKRKRKLGSFDPTPYTTPDVFQAHTSLHRPRNLKVMLHGTIRNDGF